MAFLQITDLYNIADAFIDTINLLVSGCED